MRLGIAFGFAAFAASSLTPASALADPIRIHGTASAARASGGFQDYEYGWGGAVLPAVELPVTRAFGIEAEFSALWLSKANAPRDPNIMPEGAATGYSLSVGPRLRPFAAAHDGTALSPAGFWLAGAGGVTLTNSLWRPMFDAEIGYDFLDKIGRSGFGPMFGYYHVFQPDNTLRPDDANLLLAGIHAVFDPGQAVRVRGDRDQDGLYDDEDHCPDQAEDKDGFQDADGCPDPDNDQDGIPDGQDHCPLVAEDRDGYEDTDGCPDPDNDKDGIPDVSDKCPNEPEDKDGFEDSDGCPDPDNDKDGIPDAQDLCPLEPETFNGYADTDGCPDEDQVRVLGDKIVLDDRVHFMVNSHIIRRESFPLLARLAKLIKDHPEYVHISVEGHADERGAEDFNQKLSEDRASSVKEFLVKNGVTGGRLSSKGFGSTRPLVDRKSELAYFHNRRVEFIITREAHGTASTLTIDLSKPGSLGTDGPPLPDAPSNVPGTVAPDPAPAPKALPEAPKVAPPSGGESAEHGAEP